MRALVLIALCSCSVVGWVDDHAKEAASNVGSHVAEWIACPTDLIDCGHVYLCDAAADNELGHIELCVDDDDHPEDLDAAEALYGACDLTPRHEGLCVYGCPPDAPGLPPGHGCNAFNGCFCPEGEP